MDEIGSTLYGNKIYFWLLKSRRLFISIKSIINQIDIRHNKKLELSQSMINGQVSAEARILLFIFFTLTIAILIKQIQKKFSFISYTPTLFMISVALGYFSPKQGIIGGAITQISEMDPRGILIIFLPPLIFESAFNSDWHIFRKQSTQIFILSFPSVVISALILMFSIKVILGYDSSYYDWSEAFMFGSVLSCTDTVAVLALLKEAGAPKKFNSLIQGESLFNDGTCMVLLTISFDLVKGGSPQPFSILLLFLELTLGGIVLGILFGFVSTFLIKIVSNDAILTLNISLASCYLLYFIAEYVDIGIRVSGILALVSMGLYMAAFGKTRIPAESREKMNSFWKIVIYLTQTIIFIVGGVLVGTNVLNNQEMEVVTKNDIFRLLGLYLCMMMARFLSIAVFMPKLKNQGYGLKWNQVIILTYGGLRGAVGIAFTLVLAADTALDRKFTFICLFNMAGCSILTLVINASTAGFFIKKLGLCVKSDTKARLFMKFMNECSKDLKEKLKQLQNNKYLKDSNWQKVVERGGLIDLEKHLGKLSQKVRLTTQQIRNTNIQMHNLQTNLLDQHGISQADQILMMEIRNRFCVVLKGIFWEKFQRNQCSRQSIIVLIECVDWDLDTLDAALDSWEFLVSHIHNKYIFPLSFWFKNYPIIGGIADSIIFDKAGFTYDVVSTYLQGLMECETKCRQFPFDLHYLDKAIDESQQNRKLAKNYLDYEIKIAYPEIMKRIQTDKAAQSILNYEKILLEETYRYGQIDQQFYKQLLGTIQNHISRVENDSARKQNIKEIDMLMANQFFKEMGEDDVEFLLTKKIEITVQKDQSLIKAYEKQKYLYLITRGEMSEECRKNGETVLKKSKRLYQFVGVNSILLANRKELQHSATATSLVCLFGFPLSEIREIIIKKEKLEGILYKDALLCFIRSQPNFQKLNITHENVINIKKYIDFFRLAKKEDTIVDGKNLMLLEGKISIGQGEISESGYYEIREQEKAKIHGPAKYFLFEANIGLKDLRKLRKSSEIRHPNRILQDRKTDVIYERAVYN